MKATTSLFSLFLTSSAVAQGLAPPDGTTERSLYFGELLNRYQLGAEMAAGDAAACLKADSDRWRSRVLAQCTNEECRNAASEEKLAELYALQPGASQLSDWDPPAVPALIAVLAPESALDTTQASAALGPDLDVEGELVRATESAEHMGIAVRSDNGEEHVVIFDFDIGNQPVHGTLEARMSVDPQARYRVRGFGDVAADGIANFNSAQCRFLYHLSPE